MTDENAQRIDDAQCGVWRSLVFLTDAKEKFFEANNSLKPNKNTDYAIAPINATSYLNSLVEISDEIVELEEDIRRNICESSPAVREKEKDTIDSLLEWPVEMKKKVEHVDNLGVALALKRYKVNIRRVGELYAQRDIDGKRYGVTIEENLNPEEDSSYTSYAAVLTVDDNPVNHKYLPTDLFDFIKNKKGCGNRVWSEDETVFFVNTQETVDKYGKVKMVSEVVDYLLESVALQSRLKEGLKDI